MPKLTKTAVDKAQPAEKEYFLWDDGLKGFGLRVTPSGAKSFLFQYRVGGGRGATLRRAKIGAYGTLTPAQAREIAERWAAEVAQGGDPSGERQDKRAAPRMSDLFDRYLTDHAAPHKKASSQEEDERLLRIFLRPFFERRKVAEVMRAEVDRFHKSLAEKPYRANRALALLSKAFNLSEVWGWRPDGSNPCRHIRKYGEKRRERFLSSQEMAALGGALAAAERGDIRVTRAEGSQAGAPISPYAVAALRLLIFTGARRGEILGLRWAEVNFTAARLELPDSKSGAKFVYLPAPALNVLHSLERVADNPFVIVGGKEGAHLVNIKAPWDAIRAAAGLPDVRIHDLRHSFASVGAGGGMSLPMIGALLGHKETATTARYAHLSDDPLRAAADAIGGRIAAAMTPPEAQEKTHGT